MQDKAIFDKFFQNRYYENAHFNFTNLFMWRKAYQIEWAVEEGILYLKAVGEGQTFALPPFGPDSRMHVAVRTLQEYFNEQNLPFVMQGAERFMVSLLEEMLPGAFRYISDRDNFDYVYRAQDLIELKGRAYHSKKNHLNSFRKNYSEYSYSPLTAEWCEQCIENAKEWYLSHSDLADPLLLAERNAIIEVLANFDHMQLKGGVISINGKVEAFSFGEPLNSDTVVIHVEKANPEIRGIYAAINQEFCRNSWTDMEFINREEDMGVPGLRKAKQSYHPVKMIEKFIIEQV